MTDRRRINAPSGGTAPPVFASAFAGPEALQSQRPGRTRRPDEPRKIFLKTGLTPSASGSSYLELSPSSPAPTTGANQPSLISPSSSLKITCAVHGPKPLPRSSPFSPHLVLTTHVKFAPFAARQRRGYIRDASERDLSVHLETALRGVIIGDRWPKSGVDVIITVLEGEEDRWWGDELGGGTTGIGGGQGWGMMSVLAGCITAASAAIADAGIDCVDLVAGGVAALVKDVKGKKEGETQLVLDPCPSEHRQIEAACVVGYLAGRDEVTELWMKGNAGDATEGIVERSVQAALASRTVLAEAVKEAVLLKFPELAQTDAGASKLSGGSSEVEMAG